MHYPDLRWRARCQGKSRDDVSGRIYVWLYAENPKIYLEIREKHDQEILQIDLHSLKVWSVEWLLKFQPNKCYRLIVLQLEKKSIKITHIIFQTMEPSII